jgi:hypothetical protein
VLYLVTWCVHHVIRHSTAQPWTFDKSTELLVLLSATDRWFCVGGKIQCCLKWILSKGKVGDDEGGGLYGNAYSASCLTNQVCNWLIGRWECCQTGHGTLAANVT